MTGAIASTDLTTALCLYSSSGEHADKMPASTAVTCPAPPRGTSTWYSTLQVTDSIMLIYAEILLSVETAIAKSK